MNGIYCISLGAFMLAAACRNREEMTPFMYYAILGTFGALVGGMIK